MTMNKIEQAIAIVGENAGDDYILKPDRHAGLFADQMPELAQILKRAELAEVAGRYEEADKAAIEAPSPFKKYSERARQYVFLTACCSALLLAAATLFGRPDQQTLARTLFIVLSTAAIVAGFLASTHIRLVENMKLLEKWMQHRANAEMQRLDYFNRFIRRQSAASTDPVLMELLRLEVFRRFQLDMQLTFYTQRGRQHGRVAEKAAAVSTWAMGGAGLAAGIAGFLGSTIDARWAAIAGLGFVCQAFATNVISKEAINQDRRNEERYGRTKEILKNLRMRLDGVRAQIAAGNREMLEKFVAAVHDQLSVEHRQWTDDISLASKALVELEEQLQRADSTQDARDD